MNQDVAKAIAPSFLPLMLDCGPPGEIVGYISPKPNSDENTNERQSFAPHHQPLPKKATHVHLPIYWSHLHIKGNTTTKKKYNYATKNAHAHTAPKTQEKVSDRQCVCATNSFRCGAADASRRSLSPSCSSFPRRLARSLPEGKASAT